MRMISCTNITYFS